MVMNKHGKGNKKAQRKRRMERKSRLPKKQPEIAFLIDGNFSYYPVAYCTSKKAFLTVGLADTHRCKIRQCHCFKKCGDDE